MTYENYLKSKGYLVTTIKGQLRKIKHFEGYLKANNIEIEHITYNAVMGYVQQLKPTNTSKSLNHAIRIVKTYLDYQIALGILMENPIDKENLYIRGEKRYTLYKLLKREELIELYHTFNSGNGKLRQLSKLARHRDKVVLGLFCFQGLSTTDIKRITVTDLNLGQGTIYVSGSRKTNSRTLNIEGFQILEIQNYLTQTRDKLRELKQHTPTELLVEGNIHNIITNLFKRLKGINPDITTTHQIRTSVIGLWLREYGLRKTQVMAGHRFISSTERYLGNDMDDLHNVVDNFHPLQ